jgi:hypothetical protein
MERRAIKVMIEPWGSAGQEATLSACSPGIPTGPQSQLASQERNVCIACPQRWQGMSCDRCSSEVSTVSHMIFGLPPVASNPEI